MRNLRAPAPPRQTLPQPQPTPPAERARMHTDLAAGYYERGQMDVALDELKLAVTLDPNNARAYNVYGLVYTVLGEDSKAEQNFESRAAARAQRLRHPPQLGLVPVPAQA